ncbi:MAG TPA: tetratricopeptide repeat protein [Pyrinomonadaceae bacterium]|nr:tetratricopeptide repeat protein [Pyrinomonadaceae bacterium]
MSQHSSPRKSIVLTTHDRRRIVCAAVFFLSVAAVFFTFRGAQAGFNNTSASNAYHEEIAKNYDFKFGANPFLPSNATTTTGKFIPAEMFIAADRCAKCHTDAHAQWLQSAHRNAFREPFYQKNVKDLISQRGIEFTRHCESCHNPAALFSGALTKNAKVKRPFDEDGVSCIACHSIQTGTGRGVGGYVMAEPALLVREDGTRLLNVADQEILDDVPSHRRAMMRPLLKSTEFCAACHKSQVPQQLNDYKFLRAFSVGDEFQQSSFSKESPHPFYTRDKESCNSCHMKKEAAPLFDVAAKEGKLSSHRWPAANTAIPFFYKWPEQLDAVRKFLEADAVGIDIFAVTRRSARTGATEFIAPVNHSRFQLDAGDALTADVVITNKNIGHSFPPELRDFYEAYVEFTVKDEAGQVLYNSGFIKPNGHLDDSAHNYKTYLVKGDGAFNDRHHIWRTKVTAQNNQIQSGRSDLARYQFDVPANLQGKLTLTARVRYRRFTRVFQDYALGKSIDYPIVTMATTEYSLRVGENAAQPVVTNAKGVMPDWRRWNNYGIALLDHRQYALSAEAFARAAELDETYRSMAKVNRALALFELEQYEPSARLLDEVLALNPNNLRALFQRTRIHIKRGELQVAEANLKRILDTYPRDRQSWQQLGELCKIKRDFAGARHCYETVLSIDPEDTGAHYNLMLVYRKLGMTEDARREAKIFADQKDDPAALSLANDFLRKRPEMSNESVPWHVHNLSEWKGTSSASKESAGGGVE